MYAPFVILPFRDSRLPEKEATVEESDYCVLGALTNLSPRDPVLCYPFYVQIPVPSTPHPAVNHILLLPLQPPPAAPLTTPPKLWSLSPMR